MRAQLTAQAPEGWELMSAIAMMEKAGSMCSVEGKYLRRDRAREIEADDMGAREAQVSDGWMMLAVRRT
ncbi:hypothetical protein [Microbacterium sp. As-52]|uniref:hypothetical protein n=1 Tax=Microbacterium sp. As-52 TaxID=3390503 RepID=UPI003CF478ED